MTGKEPSLFDVDAAHPSFFKLQGLDRIEDDPPKGTPYRSY